MSVNITESHDAISKFLSDNNVGVLATVDSAGRPHAATVYLAHDRLFNLYFVTKKETQKSRNLQNNGRAAIAVYDAATQTTVQTDGTASEVTDTQLAESIMTEIWKVALQTSHSHVTPPARMIAGGYVVYRLSAPTLRMATFNRQDSADYDNIFETVNTEPRPQ